MILQPITRRTWLDEFTDEMRVKYYLGLQERFSMGRKALAEKIGVSQSSISYFLKTQGIPCTMKARQHNIRKFIAWWDNGGDRAPDEADAKMPPLQEQAKNIGITNFSTELTGAYKAANLTQLISLLLKDGDKCNIKIEVTRYDV